MNTKSNSVSLKQTLRMLSEPLPKMITVREEYVRFAKVSPRQKDVWRAVAEGLLNRDIAERLKLSEKTVEHHRDQLNKKLCARNSADLTRSAVRFGIITVEVLP
jgi:DNA-binding NarL/FixJ family response regulator